MINAICKFKIFIKVVLLVSVDVVNKFIFSKVAAKPFFHHKSVLKNVAVGSLIGMIQGFYGNIATLYNSTTFPLRAIFPLKMLKFLTFLWRNNPRLKNVSAHQRTNFSCFKTTLWNRKNFSADYAFFRYWAASPICAFFTHINTNAAFISTKLRAKLHFTARIFKENIFAALTYFFNHTLSPKNNRSLIYCTAIILLCQLCTPLHAEEGVEVIAGFDDKSYLPVLNNEIRKLDEKSQDIDDRLVVVEAVTT